MAVVLVRTYRNSKFVYLYTCAALMFLSTVFDLIGTILYSWKYGCSVLYADNDKCHGEPTANWVANV
jgi:hypothetical protein